MRRMGAGMAWRNGGLWHGLSLLSPSRARTGRWLLKGGGGGVSLTGCHTHKHTQTVVVVVVTALSKKKKKKRFFLSN